MIKVLHIITRLDMGGSAQNTLKSCQALAGHYDMVLAHGLSEESLMTDLERQRVAADVSKAKDSGVTLVPIPDLVRRIAPICDIKAFVAILRLLIKEKPVILHTHSSKAGLLGRWAAWLLRWLFRVPVVIHTPHGHVFFGHFGPIKSHIFLVLERLTDPITNCTVALTEGERKDYVKMSVSPDHKLVTIHSGVDIGPYQNCPVDITQKRQSLGFSDDDTIIAMVGWLLPIKGPEYLLEAMIPILKNLSSPRVKLIFVGKGDLEPALRRRADEMCVSEYVTFLGWRDDIPQIMQAIDILVLPSMNEGMGRVLVEAMAAGKPCVASRVGGIPDLILDGKNGFLVEPGDVAALAKAIGALISNRELRHQMGANGKVVAQRYSVEKMVEQIDMLYKTLAAEWEKQA